MKEIQNKKYQYPKDFIKGVLINEIGDITKTHAYLSFVLISVGIEFLGRCIDDSVRWEEQKSGLFNNAIAKLMPKYMPYRLYELLRCGLAHSMTPQKGLDLTETRHNKKHLSVDSDGKLVLVIEDFYNDFKCACEKVINEIDNKIYKQNSKIYKTLLEVE